MNSKQLFFFSLILLSVAMGMHWFKNRPKARPVKSNRPRVALNLSDLQLQDGTEASSTSETGEDTTEQPEEGQEGEETSTDGSDAAEGEETGEPPAGGDEGSETASGTTEVASAAVDLMDSDPVIIALKKMPRNPFERSPYAQLVEQLRMAMDAKDEPEAKKAVSLLTAAFSATIQTESELVAVIDRSLFRKGETFQDKKITDIKPEYVTMENDSGIFLLPKTGVNININPEDGTYTVEDNYHKN
ncbi:hypothetical protein MASR1M12_22580 [Erysipelotrichia bacterium]